MRLETSEFIVTGCAWHRKTSRERVSPLIGEMQRDRIKTVSLTCRSCNSVWVATNGDDDGQFSSALSSLYVTCPNGETKGQIALDSLW